MKQYIRHGFPHNVDAAIKPFKNVSDYLTICEGCVMYRDRVFIPLKLRGKVLEQFHSDHPGIVAMKSIVRSLVWYPGIDRDVERLVQSCSVCVQNRSKPSQNKTVEWPKPNKKWSRIHIDHFFVENKILFVVVDALTKYMECEIVSSTNVAETIDCLRTIFSRHGLPDIVVSDNFSSFLSYEFQKFLRDNCIEHLTIAPGHAPTNGQAERSVQVLKRLLSKNSKGSFKNRLSSSLLYYRNVPHSSTGISPSVALNGRRYVTLK